MMKVQRFSLAILLALGLALMAGPAGGSIIEDDFALNRVSQIVHLKGSSFDGEIPFVLLSRIMPDGTEVPFVMPKDRALLMVKFYFDFKTTSTQTFVNLRIIPFGFWLPGSNIVNGVASAVSTWPPGLPIGGPTDNYKIQAVFNNVVIPGNLTVYITGMLFNPNVNVSPISLLLCD